MASSLDALKLVRQRGGEAQQAVSNEIQAQGDMERAPLTAHAALAKQIKWLGTLGHVIPWGLLQKPPWIVVDVVIQDEYTHDVILAREGADQRGGEGRAQDRAQDRAQGRDERRDERGGDGSVLILDCT